MSDEAFKLYEDGKHRRYALLFSVNGGAFAIAKLLLDAKPLRDEAGHDIGNQAVHVIGNLTLPELAVGMAVFTAIMVLDIYLFGEKMRKRLPDAFHWQGKMVLLLIGLLICAGWLRAGL